MPKKTLSVTISGKKFTRTTERAYTHVLVGRRDWGAARLIAHEWSGTKERSVRDNFQHAQETADGTWWTKNGFTWNEYNDAPVRQEGRRVVALGLDGYREEVKAREIERFNEADARGAFELQVLSWHGSLRAAGAAHKTASNRGFYTDLVIIEIASAQG